MIDERRIWSWADFAHDIVSDKYLCKGSDRMRIAICDDEKSVGQILEEKVKKLLPDAVVETYLSGDALISSGC